MRLILLKVVDAHKKVGIACLKAIFVEKLFNDLDVANIGAFTLLLHIHGVIKGSHKPIRLQNPTQVFVLEHVLAVMIV